jgi:hypothetical protein
VKKMELFFMRIPAHIKLDFPENFKRRKSNHNYDHQKSTPKKRAEHEKLEDLGLPDF